MTERSRKAWIELRPERMDEDGARTCLRFDQIIANLEGPDKKVEVLRVIELGRRDDGKP